MKKYKGFALLGSVVLIAAVLAGCFGVKSSPVDELPWLKDVDWIFTDDFSEYELGQFPDANWVSYPPERHITWDIVEFDRSASGYALRAQDAGVNPNRLILEKDLEQKRTGKIVVQARLWMDNQGLQGVDLWNKAHTWPNYASVHRWNLGQFAEAAELRAYDTVVVMRLKDKTIDVYVNGSLFKSGIPFRDDPTIPEVETYHVGLSFNAENNSTPVYWEMVRVGVLD